MVSGQCMCITTCLAIYRTRGQHANYYTSNAVIVGGKSVKIPKGVIRSRKSTKDRQNNGQTEKYITTNNEPQKNYTEKYRLWNMNSTKYHWMNFVCLGRVNSCWSWSSYSGTPKNPGMNYGA